MKKAILFTILFSLSFVSCDDGFDLFSNNRTVAALKEALIFGSENSVSTIRSVGYLNDDLIKIALPQEAQNAFKVINALEGNVLTKFLLDALNIEPNLESTLVELINGAATDAVPAAAGVFKNAITGMTISDGKNILFGADNAATQYLHDNTYTQLQDAFEPTITNSLNTVSIGNFTPNTAWARLSNINNSMSNIINNSTIASTLLNSQGISVAPLPESLSDYVTGKALDGLFTKVAGEELKIRTNPAARTTDLLKEIFGQLDNR